MVAVAAAWWLLQGIGLGATPFHTRGEPREAVVVQDLVRHGNWILPRRNAEQLPRKPPLFYWLGGMAARATGAVDERSVRLPSAVLSGASAVLLAAVSGAAYGPIAALASGIVLLTSFEWLRAATAARVDMTLAFGLTLAFLALLRRRAGGGTLSLVVFYAGVIWATLAKGIPGIAIPALTVALVTVADRRLDFARGLHPFIGGLVVLLATGAWYVAAAAQGGPEFLTIVLRENLVRVVADDETGLGHQHGIGYLLGMLLLGLLPWTLLLPSVGLALWRDRDGTDRGDPRRLALLWSLAVLAPYAVAASKRGVYLLPLYPAVALLVGWWASAAGRGAAPAPWLGRGLAMLGWAAAALLALLAALVALQAVGIPLLTLLPPLLGARAAADAEPIVDAANLPLAGCFAVAAAATLLLALTASRQRWYAALAALATCVGAVIIGVRLVVLPAIGAAESRRPHAEALRRALADPSTLHTVAGLDYGTLFYWDAPIPAFDPAGPDAPPMHLLLPADAWHRLPPHVRARYRRMPGLQGDGYLVLELVH